MSPAHSGRVAIVTGGASGIGRAVTEALAERGCFPVIFDIDAEGAKKVVDDLAAAGKKAGAVTVDVRDRTAVADAVNDVVREHKHLDYMFNNAGISVMGEALDYDWEAWKDVIDTILYGVVHGVAACYPIMVAQRSGHIVNTASLAGLMPTPWATSYTAAKAGVWGLSIALRVEAAAHGVNVSCVCPAAVTTPMVNTARFINLDRERAYAVVPGGRITAEVCARAILRGVDRNQAVIAPSAAKWMSLFYRMTPGLAERAMLAISSRLGAVRGDYLKLNPKRSLLDESTARKAG